MRTILLAATIAMLAGCSSTPQGLERPEFATTFTVAQGYQLTLKNIVAGDNACRSGSLVPIGQVINDVEHYPDLREAKIVQGASGVGRQIYRVIAISEPAPNQSQVTVYTKHQGERIAGQLRAWATGSTDCSV